MSGDQHQPRSVIALIREIQRGALAPKMITTDDRQRCVEHLTGEGYSAVEISEVLQVSERTVARDRSAMRQANAIERDPRLVDEMIGRLVTEADHTIQRIRRAARQSDVDPSIKIDGERTCWMITRQLIEQLQKLGYLPTAATEIRGDLTHHIDALPPFSEMQEEVARIELILGHSADQGDEELRVQLAALRDQVQRGALVEQIALMESHLSSEGGSPDESADQTTVV